jgi:hypothetical protein
MVSQRHSTLTVERRNSAAQLNVGVTERYEGFMALALKAADFRHRSSTSVAASSLIEFLTGERDSPDTIAALPYAR